MMRWGGILETTNAFKLACDLAHTVYQIKIKIAIYKDKYMHIGLIKYIIYKYRV